MAKRQALGRGLSALLENSNESRDVFEAPVVTPIADEKSIGRMAGGNIAMLGISEIEANPFQPRSHFDRDALEELASSIRTFGIIQPITVRKVSAKKYQLISGERRFRASQIARIEEIPAYIREANDQAMLEMALVENIQRENLDAIEVAISYQRLIEECELTQEELSEKVGKKRSTVANYLRLLKLPAEVQVGIIEKKISMGHARAIVTIENEDKQLKIFNRIIKDGLSVRKVEELARNKTSNAKSDEVSSLSFSEMNMQDEIREKLSTSVKVNKKSDGSGKIEISFANSDDLKRIADLMDL